MGLQSKELQRQSLLLNILSGVVLSSWLVGSLHPPPFLPSLTGDAACAHRGLANRSFAFDLQA